MFPSFRAHTFLVLALCTVLTAFKSSFAALEAETIPEIPGAQYVHIQAPVGTQVSREQVLAQMRQWRQSTAAQVPVQGVEIVHPEADLYAQQWYKAIDPSRGRVVSRYANVPRMLFYGPTGAGKSQKYKQIIAQSKLINPQVLVLRINSSSVVNTYQNSGADTIKKYKEQVREAWNAGRPVIVIFEEIHEIASINKAKGESAQDAQSSAAAELDLFMDECEGRGVLFIATTNYLYDLAPALRSRFNQQLKFNRYDKAMCEKLIRYKLLHEFGKPLLHEQEELPAPAIAPLCDVKDSREQAQEVFRKDPIDNAIGKRISLAAREVLGDLYAETIDEQEQWLSRVDALLNTLDMQTYDTAAVHELEGLLKSLENAQEAFLKRMARERNKTKADVMQFYAKAMHECVADVRIYLKRYVFVFNQKDAIDLLAAATAGKDVRFLNALVQELVAESQMCRDGVITHDFVVKKIAEVEKRFSDESEKWNAHERHEAEDIRVALEMIDACIRVECRDGNKASVDRIKKEFGYDKYKKRAEELFKKNNPE